MSVGRAFVEKSLRGNILRTYSTDPADGIVTIHLPLKCVSRWFLRIIENCLPPLFSAGRSILAMLRNEFMLRHCVRWRTIWAPMSIGICSSASSQRRLDGFCRYESLRGRILDWCSMGSVGLVQSVAGVFLWSSVALTCSQRNPALNVSRGAEQLASTQGEELKCEIQENGVRQS